MADPNPERIIRRLKRQQRRLERAYAVFIESMGELRELGFPVSSMNTFHAGINRPLVRSHQNLSAAVSALERHYGAQSDADCVDDE